MICPHCNREIVISVRKPENMSTSWQINKRHEFQSVKPWEQSIAPPITTGNYEATRQSPARAATLESDVIVPLFQSLGTGLVVLASSIPIAIWLQWEWYTPLIIGGTIVTVSWLRLMNMHHKLLWIVESFSQSDNEEKPAKSQPKPKPLSLEVKHQDHGKINRFQYLDLPANITQDLLIDWSISIVNGVKTPAQSNWTGNGKPFSKADYNQFVKALCEAGILRLKGKDHNAGYTLTVGGKHALTSLINGKLE